LTKQAALASTTRTDRGALMTGTVEKAPVEILVDLDGRIRRGKCVCGYFRKYGIRNGPCRHMIVLRYLSTPLRNPQAAVTGGFVSHN
jgi:hypothetical protein